MPRHARAGHAGRAALRGRKTLERRSYQFHGLDLIPGYNDDGVLASLANVIGRGDGRLGVDPGGVVDPGRGWLADPEGFGRIGHGFLVTAESDEGQAPAVVGFGV